MNNTKDKVAEEQAKKAKVKQKMEKICDNYQKDLAEAKQACWDTYHSVYKPINTTLPDLGTARKIVKKDIELFPEFEVLAGLISSEDFKKQEEQKMEETTKKVVDMEVAEEKEINNIVGEIIIQCGMLVKHEQFGKLINKLFN